MSVLDRITTKDVLAFMLVGGGMTFSGISLWYGKPLDAGIIGMVGLVVGYYFPSGQAAAYRPEPVDAPALGEPADE